MGSEKSKLLLVPIEILARERDSRILISLKLLKLNPEWKIILGRTEMVGSYWRNKNDNKKFIFLSKGPNFSKSYFQKLISKNGYYFLLDEEGAIFSKFVEKNWTRGGKNNDLVKYISKILFWGNITKENYFQNHKDFINEEKIEICGNPRFDLSKKNYRNYFRFLSNKNNLTNFIMIDTAFAVYNNIVSLDAQKEHWTKVIKYTGRGDIAANKWYDLTKKTYDFQSKLLPKFIEGIKYIARNLPDYDFLLRPHPSEDVNTYKRNLKEIKNIKISNHDSAVSKFINAKMIIHNGCSTAVEACLGDIPSICFLPENSVDQIQELPRKISYIAENKEDLLKKTLNIFSEKIDKKEFSIFKEKIKPHIDNIDYDSSDKIAKIINNFDFSRSFEIDFDKTLKGYLEKYLPKPFFNTLVSFKKLFNKKDRTSTVAAFKKRDKIKFEKLTLSDLQLRINAFSEVIKDLPHIKLVEINKDLFELKVD